MQFETVDGSFWYRRNRKEGADTQRRIGEIGDAAGEQMTKYDWMREEERYDK